MNFEYLAKPPVTRKIKAVRVLLSPGEEVGEHSTEKREEIIIILRGIATVIVEGKTIKLEEGKIHFIGEGKKHNIKNEHTADLEYIYVVSLFD
jgi:quercetin dioxygenase-like cupin family protein